MVKKSDAKTKKPSTSKVKKIITKSKKEVKVTKPKTVTKKTVKKEPQFSKNDINLIEESFNLVKNLNSEVQKVQKVKDKLKQDVSKLGQRLDKHEEKTSTKSNTNVLATLKEDIIKEFTPLLKKFDFKSVKADIFKEIEGIIETESAKLKSELDSKSKKTHRDFNKKFSELESRLVDALSSSDKIKRELKNFESKKVSKIKAELEQKLGEVIDSTSKKLYAKYASNINELSFVKDELTNQKKKSDSLENSIKKLKIQIGKTLDNDAIDLSSIESKIKKLDEDNSAIKSLVERYENELFNRKKDETFEVETRVKNLVKKAKDELVEVHKEKGLQEQFLVEKVNEIIDQVNAFESKFKAKEKRDSKNIKEDVVKITGEMFSQIEEESKNLLKLQNKDIKEIQKFAEEFKTDREIYKEFVINKFNEAIDQINVFEKRIALMEKKDSKNLEKQLDKALKETLLKLEKKEKEYIEKRKVDLKKLTEFENKLEVETESHKDYLANKVNEIVTEFENFSKEAKKDFKLSEVELRKDLKFDFNRISKDFREEFARLTLVNNETLTRLNTDSKEDRKRLSEDIETRLVVAKNQFEEDFKTHLLSFDTELKNKESEFLSKLAIIEEEKNQMLSDLNNFKEEIATLTKNYTNEVHEELQTIKSEELNFNVQKDQFLGEMSRLTDVKKVELEDVAEGLGKKLNNIIFEQKETFDRHENTFREVFNQKVHNLHEVTHKRIDNIEKKFIEKNLKVVQNKIDEEIKTIQLMSDTLTSRKDELDKKVQELIAKEEDFEAQVFAQEDQLKGRIEERLVGLEKQLNKRFLELDGNFSTFKGVVVDEVEDLIKEVTSLVSKKVEMVDKAAAKASFATKDIQEKVGTLANIDKLVDDQIRDVRDEINDLRIKLEIISPTHVTMSDHVQHMNDYERQLIALVDSLKQRGVTDHKIKQALVDKGHPLFYISMIVDNYEKVYNS